MRANIKLGKQGAGICKGGTHKIGPYRKFWGFLSDIAGDKGGLKRRARMGYLCNTGMCRMGAWQLKKPRSNATCAIKAFYGCLIKSYT
jgi:hypothetical protein